MVRREVHPLPRQTKVRAVSVRNVKCRTESYARTAANQSEKSLCPALSILAIGKVARRKLRDLAAGRLRIAMVKDRNAMERGYSH